MIKTQKLNKFYNNKHILKELNCIIEKNDKVAIIGPSGSGKSRFLRCLNLLETKASGKIFFKDIEITYEKSYLNNSKNLKICKGKSLNYD